MERGAMKIGLANSNGWRLRESPFPFQQTYVTPRTDVSRFVRTLLAPFEFGEAAIWIETIIFNPNELIDYLHSLGIDTDESELNSSVIHASNASEASSLLERVLTDWIDFVFIPSPNEFVIYADHDNYTTIFSASARLLVLLRSNMNLQEFRAVDDWFWTGPHSQD
jgi:hypothetical protein